MNDITDYLPSDQLFVVFYTDNGNLTFPVTTWGKVAQLFASKYLDVHPEEVNKVLDQLFSKENFEFYINQKPPDDFIEMIKIWDKFTRQDPSNICSITPSEEDYLKVVKNLTNLPQGNYPMLDYYDGRYRGEWNLQLYFFNEDEIIDNQIKDHHTLDSTLPILRSKYRNIYFRNKRESQIAQNLLNNEKRHIKAKKDSKDKISGTFKIFVEDQYERFEHLGKEECLEVLKLMWECSDTNIKNIYRKKKHQNECI